MVKAPTKTLTFSEFLKLPETKPSLEYINGQIIQKPIPHGKHSTIQGELIIAINAVTKTQLVEGMICFSGQLINFQLSNL
jgi:Uma2 family endonuclease